MTTVNVRRPLPLQKRVLIVLADEQARVLAERRATEIVVLSLAPVSPTQAGDDTTTTLPVWLENVWHLACRDDYVVRLDGTT
ncbi:hypothetical protein NHG68_25790 (plasmid) [Enterobacter sp. Z1]|uniref:hypothetical protein n=1 Tax=Enterobacter TaxID=547 RepID=UPI0011DF4A3F|nr:hypothetical protein [Enterobacter sp. Z1]TYC99240.1 hypothetical protein E4M14_025385 [Enterobacter sp. Z1]USX34157.1 hypothetical protein NHG68_25790 [Enterobacter sp. Z1]